MFDAIAHSAAKLCEGHFCHVFQFDGELLHFVAEHGHSAEALEASRSDFSTPPNRGSAAGRSILSGAVEHIPDVDRDPEYTFGAVARSSPSGVSLAVPMLREGRPIGAITVGRAHPGRFSDRQIDLLETFADQAVIAIENVRLFKELEARNRELTETLEQQTATGEILRVIVELADRGPAGLRHDRRRARHGSVRPPTPTSGSGKEIGLAVVASVGALPVTRRELTISRQSVAGRAVNDRRAVHVEDLAEVFHEEFPDSWGMLSLGNRTILAMPLLREGEPIGVIMIRRTEVRPFSIGQVALLKTFADQAVIAIENGRLFQELEVRNRDLTETLGQQTATGEILRVISRSPTNIQPVLDAVTESAARLCETSDVVIFLRDGESLASPRITARSPSSPLSPWSAGRAMAERCWTGAPSTSLTCRPRPMNSRRAVRTRGSWATARYSACP